MRKAPPVKAELPPREASGEISVRGTDRVLGDGAQHGDQADRQAEPGQPDEVDRAADPRRCIIDDLNHRDGRPGSEPRLVVLLVIDQWPEWAFEAKRPAFTGGFDRLLREGEWHVGQRVRHTRYGSGTIVMIALDTIVPGKGNGEMIEAPYTGVPVRISPVWGGDLAGFGRVRI